MLKLRNIISIFLIAGISSPPAYAAQANTSTAGAPLFIALAIAYLTRRMSIGGWLFYYYFQLYGSLLLSLLLGGLIIENLNPEGWEDRAQYSLFIISTVPMYLVKIIETIFATRLLVKSQRNSNNVKVLRYILLASVVVYATSLAIDYYNFPDNIALSIFGFVFATIWALYFFVSYRVNYVLSNWSGEWDYPSFKQRVTVKLEPEQNQG